MQNVRVLGHILHTNSMHLKFIRTEMAQPTLFFKLKKNSIFIAEKLAYFQFIFK